MIASLTKGDENMKKLYKKFFESRTELTEAECRRSRNLFVVEAGILPFISVALRGTYLTAFIDISGKLSLNLGVVRLGNMQLLFLISAVFNLMFCLFLGNRKIRT